MPIYKFEDFTSQIVETEDIEDSQKDRNLSNIFCPSKINVSKEILSIDFLKYIQTGTPKNGAEFLKIVLEYFDEVLEITSIPEMLNVVYFLGCNLEKFSRIIISFHYEMEDGRPIEEIEQDLNDIILLNENERKNSKGIKSKKDNSDPTIDELIDKLKGGGAEVHKTEMRLDSDDPISQMFMMMLMSKMMKGKNKRKEEEDDNNEE